MRGSLGPEACAPLRNARTPPRCRKSKAPATRVEPNATSKPNVGLIVGFTVAAGAAAAIMIIICLCCCRRKRKAARALNAASSGSNVSEVPVEPGVVSGPNQAPFQGPSVPRNSDVPASRTGNASGTSASPSLQQTMHAVSDPSMDSSAVSGDLQPLKQVGSLQSMPSGHQPALPVRVVPPHVGTQTSVGSATTARPSTVLEPDERSKLSTALSNMATMQPPILFAGRFLLIDEQAHGGQAVVAFARDNSGVFPYAIKCALPRSACR